MADFAGEICQDRGRLGCPSRQRRAPRAPWGLPTPNPRSTLGQRSVNVGSTLGIFPSHRGPIFADFAGFVDQNRRSEDMHFSNGRFSKKETGFSGPFVVWSLLGAPGEKKRENQMFLHFSFVLLQSSAIFQISRPLRQLLQKFTHFSLNFRRDSRFCRMLSKSHSI